MQLLENFILLVGSTLHSFSSINRLICPIGRNSHQINCVLKVFYNDIGVYFNVCTKIIYIYIICIRMYIVHIMNLKINIWISNFWFEYDIFNLNSKRLIWFKNWYLNFKLIFLNPKINISIQTIINWLWKWKFWFWIFLYEYENLYFNFENFAFKF